MGDVASNVVSRHALSSHAEEGGRRQVKIKGGTQKKWKNKEYRTRIEKGEEERGGMPWVSHHDTLFH